MGFDEQTLQALCAQLADDLAATKGTGDAQVEKIVATLSGAFGVSENEVALFRLSADRNLLRFLWPAKLRQVGAIPFSSLDSLAARTAREGVVFLENTFAAQRHANAYEKVRLEPGISSPPKPIRKIISAPILQGETVIGVIQISRKGDLDGPEIDDFSQADADALLILASEVGNYL
ncbi:hypothetical protein JCM30471_33000 [Desulfuromonas carbonis]|uniref:GAF domain-containing protein n=1 Tax=Desulfuromonas sp. DDH964 TaxID=1823759 RepID=UPI00078CCD57|nr:GAF domain-containing protein [Desulfuromonas sp. DDH964]AMV71460.1 hypothetical protein DBW_1081 [Desulfuromonas sp. DDH964]